ncbi:hypothetical protein Tco_1160061, partial [Tanacetum coccineum]
MGSLNSNSQEREMHQLQQMQDKAKESCTISLRLLHSHLKALLNNNLKELPSREDSNGSYDTQERAKHKREYDKMMQSKEGKVESSKALDAGLVVTESNETESERHVSSSRSGKDTHAEDADINSVNDKQPMDEVQLFAEHNIRANEQQHSEQSESVYDTYVLEKVYRNTIPKSTDMSHRGGEIDQNADDEK